MEVFGEGGPAERARTLAGPGTRGSLEVAEAEKGKVKGTNPENEAW